MAVNPVYYSRTKHVEIDVHFIRDKVATKEVEIRYVPTREQTAYCLTKALTHSKLEFMRNKLGVVQIPSSLKGRVKA